MKTCPLKWSKFWFTGVFCLVLFFLLSFFPVKPIWGQSEWLEKKAQFQVENISIDAARREAQEKGLLQMTEHLGKDFLGEERFVKNKALIIAQIHKNSAKYIPFSKTAVLESKGNIHTVQVEMKSSPSSFRQLLQGQGLLSQGEAQPVVMVYIYWTDKVKNKSYRWWKDRADVSADPLPRFERALEASLKSAFLKNGFYVWRPFDFGLWNQLPALYRSERLAPDDFQTLSLYYQAPLAIEGAMAISAAKEDSDRFQIDLKWTAFFADNGKTVGDVSRQFLTDAGVQDRVVEKKLKEVMDGVASDLATQIFEAWQKGTLSTRVLRLTFPNPPNLKSQENLKEKIRSEFSMIKAIRERLLSRELISYEIETLLSPADMALKIGNFEFEGKMFKADMNGDTEIVLRVR
ncbi:MAG: hypothetical protein JNM39_17470 [Bdellovibrionaceae bacterium]|nr:hypothetical protein [Pseudobdellovibrionaceae bacterium]